MSTEPTFVKLQNAILQIYPNSLSISESNDATNALVEYLQILKEIADKAKLKSRKGQEVSDSNVSNF